MGQSMKKLAPGSTGRAMEKLGDLASKFYDEKFKDPSEEWSSAKLYIAVCEVVEEINRSFGNTQFRVPNTETLQKAYVKHHNEKKGRALTKEEFIDILQDVIMETGVTGIGAKDILLYIFGVPITTLFIKQRVIPRAIPNEIFIPGVTSATVLLLAKLNKL